MNNPTLSLLQGKPANYLQTASKALQLAPKALGIPASRKPSHRLLQPPIDESTFLSTYKDQLADDIVRKNVVEGRYESTVPYGVQEALWSKVSPYIDKYGLSVIQGYRDPATAGSNSAKNSQHYIGNAIDLNYSSLNDLQRIQLVRDLQQAGITGFGTGSNTLHADIGPKRNWWYEPSGAWTTDTKYRPSWISGLFQ